MSGLDRSTTSSIIRPPIPPSSCTVTTTGVLGRSGIEEGLIGERLARHRRQHGALAAALAELARHPRGADHAGRVDARHQAAALRHARNLALLDGGAVPVFHMNDYPANPPRATITDADRVYPGDGTAPLAELVRILRAIGFRGYFSLELFNREYWKQDPHEVAKTGLTKLKAVVG